MRRLMMMRCGWQGQGKVERTGCVEPTQIAAIKSVAKSKFVQNDDGMNQTFHLSFYH